jgi:hypothetical protein
MVLLFDKASRGSVSVPLLRIHINIRTVGSMYGSQYQDLTGRGTFFLHIPGPSGPGCRIGAPLALANVGQRPINPIAQAIGLGCMGHIIAACRAAILFLMLMCMRGRGTTPRQEGRVDDSSVGCIADGSSSRPYLQTPRIRQVFDITYLYAL